MPESHVIVSNVSKLYKGAGANGGVHALNGVSLSVPDGQFLSIMGPSGSGKTTLLHIMAGLTQATSGEVVIHGTSLAGMNDHDLTLFRRKNIGVIFQAFNLIPTLTAEENILLPFLAGHAGSGQDAAAVKSALDDLLARLELTERRGHFPEMLSGGEQQRVAIARALLMDVTSNAQGTLLLADEPTGNLDSANSEIICRMLRELCDERRHTMIVVTHEEAVARWSDRTITLKDGAIVGDTPAPGRA